MKTKKCDLPAIFRFTWPGKDEDYICALHGAQLQNVANAMGLPVQLISLTPDEMAEHTCCQNLKAEEKQKCSEY